MMESFTVQACTLLTILVHQDMVHRRKHSMHDHRSFLKPLHVVIQDEVKKLPKRSAVKTYEPGVMVSTHQAFKIAVMQKGVMGERVTTIIEVKSCSRRLALSGRTLAGWLLSLLSHCRIPEGHIILIAAVRSVRVILRSALRHRPVHGLYLWLLIVATSLLSIWGLLWL